MVTKVLPPSLGSYELLGQIFSKRNKKLVLTSITIANELQVPQAKNRELQAIVAKFFETIKKEEASIFLVWLTYGVLAPPPPPNSS
jgi:hypothetical protein